MPALEKKDPDSGCQHAPYEGFECEWLVERIILPELGAQDDEDEDEDPRDSSNRLLAEAAEEVDSQGGTPQEVIAGQAGNLATLALQIGFPILKPFLEEQVRRATVTVRWKEGPKERGFDVTQYLVSDQPAPVDDAAVEEDQ